MNSKEKNEDSRL